MCTCGHEYCLLIIYSHLTAGMKIYYVFIIYKVIFSLLSSSSIKCITIQSIVCVVTCDYVLIALNLELFMFSHLQSKYKKAINQTVDFLLVATVSFCCLPSFPLFFSLFFLFALMTYLTLGGKLYS